MALSLFVFELIAVASNLSDLKRVRLCFASEFFAFAANGLRGLGGVMILAEDSHMFAKPRENYGVHRTADAYYRYRFAHTHTREKNVKIFSRRRREACSHDAESEFHAITY